MSTTGTPGIVIPQTEDGFPLVDMQIVGPVLERFPDLRMSFEAFLALDDGFRGEWIDGRVEVRGSQHILHHDAVGVLFTALHGWVRWRGHPGGDCLPHFLMRPAPDLPARIVDLLYLSPAHGNRLRHCIVDGPADMAMEVVDSESRHRDTVDKFREYARGGVREYWLVDPFERRATVFRLRDGRYEEVPTDERIVLRSEVLPGFWIDPGWIWKDWSIFDIAREWGLI